jgi:hypothetical protein
MQAESISYNMPIVVILEGILEKVHLDETFKKMIERHDSLRTSFVIIDEEPVQKIHNPEEIEFEIEYYDIKEIGDSETDRRGLIYQTQSTVETQDLASQASEAAESRGDHHHSSLITHNFVRQFIRPFDLSLAPLLRVGLIRIEEEKYILMIDMHYL